MSVENLQKRHSTPSLVSPTATFDDVLDKLKYMNYIKDFCTPKNFTPLHRYYFTTQHSNSNEQFFFFTSLFAWLTKFTKVIYEAPAQFDDPNATAANIGFIICYSSCYFKET